MKDTEFAYASARIRADENSLLGFAFLTQLAEAQDFDSAAAMLASHGYPMIEKAENLDDTLEICESELWKETEAAVGGKAELDFLIMKNDFHNLKVSVKSIAADVDPRGMFLHPCIFDPSEVYETVKSRQFDLLDPMLSKAASGGYRLITGTMDGQLYDIYIDSCYIAELLKKCEAYPFAYEYFSKYAALYDIKTALRLAETGKKSEAVLDAVVDNPMLDVQVLRLSASKSVGDVLSYIEGTEFSALSDAYKNSYAAFERACAEMLAAELEGARYVSFGTEPIIAYFIAKENEINTVRMILNCKAAKIPSLKIRERMCDVYV